MGFLDRLKWDDKKERRVEPIVCHAIRTAIVDEEEGARNYEAIAKDMKGSEKILIQSLADDEKQHKATLEKLKRELKCG